MYLNKKWNIKKRVKKIIAYNFTRLLKQELKISLECKLHCFPALAVI